MATKQVLGLFVDAQEAADATDRLQEAGFAADDYEILTGSPYPEGAFGEHVPKHRLYAFPRRGDPPYGRDTGVLSACHRRKADSLRATHGDHFI